MSIRFEHVSDNGLQEQVLIKSRDSKKAQKVVRDLMTMINKIHTEIINASEAECLTSQSEYIREFKKNQHEYTYGEDDEG